MKFFMNNKQIGKHIIYIVVSAALMLVILSLLSINVYSRTLEHTIEADKEQMDQLEKSYIKEMHRVLDRYGCEHAGITMTKVYEEDCIRYEVAINHKNLSYLKVADVNALDHELQKLVSDFAQADFSFAFSI